VNEISRDILKRARDGDMFAFQRIVETYQDYTFRLAFRLLANEDDAKDAVQECFIRVWTHLKRYKSEKKFKPWLSRIVVNLCYDELKNAHKKHTVRNVLNDELLLPSTDENFDDTLVNSELAERIKSLANGLPPKQRIVFVLRDLEDLEIEDVAGIAGLSKNSVKSNLYYARQHIRKRLKMTYEVHDM